MCTTDKGHAVPPEPHLAAVKGWSTAELTVCI